MFATLFASLFVQGILLGLAALALLAAAPRLQKRYGPQWLCRLWVTLAVLLLVPLHALVPQAPAAVSVDTTPLYSRTALSQEVTERPADGVPYMVATEGGAPTGYIVPRAELQTAPHGAGRSRRRTRLTCWPCVEPWRAGCCALSIWRHAAGASASAAPRSPLTPAGAAPCRKGRARAWSPRRWYAAPWCGHAASRTSDPHGHGSQGRRLHAGPRADPHKTA